MYKALRITTISGEEILYSGAKLKALFDTFALPYPQTAVFSMELRGAIAQYGVLEKVIMVKKRKKSDDVEHTVLKFTPPNQIALVEFAFSDEELA